MPRLAAICAEIKALIYRIEANATDAKNDAPETAQNDRLRARAMREALALLERSAGVDDWLAAICAEIKALIYRIEANATDAAKNDAPETAQNDRLRARAMREVLALLERSASVSPLKRQDYPPMTPHRSPARSSARIWA